MKKTTDFIKTEKTAKVVIHTPDNHEKDLILIHGYGQLAEDFAEEFKSLLDLGYRLIVPEALSKFYLKVSAGTMGASWMTSDNREYEIAEYLAYLKTVLDKYLTDKKVSILGFSQGTSTTTRLIEVYDQDFDHVILVAGDIPREVTFVTLKSNHFHYLCGDNDHLVKLEQIEKIAARFPDQNIICSQFEGGHQIPIDYIYNTLKN